MRVDQTLTAAPTHPPRLTLVRAGGLAQATRDVGVVGRISLQARSPCKLLMINGVFDNFHDRQATCLNAARGSSLKRQTSSRLRCVA
jgi:hypothetical protein